MHEGNSQINWWGLGSAFKDSPALGWYILTFLVFVWILVYFARKPLMLLLETRALNIEKAIEEAKLAKAKAHLQAQKYEERLKSIDVEIEALRAEYLKQGELEKAKFEESAARLATQIAKEVEDNLQAEIRHALLSLKKEMADAVIDATLAKVQSAHTAVSDQELNKTFVRDVSQLTN